MCCRCKRRTHGLVPRAAHVTTASHWSGWTEGCDRDDQQRLQKFIDQVAVGGNGSGITKEAKAAAKAAGAGEFEISYAASSRSVCKGCLKFILKGDVRPSPDTSLRPRGKCGESPLMWRAEFM